MAEISLGPERWCRPIIAALLLFATVVSCADGPDALGNAGNGASGVVTGTEAEKLLGNSACGDLTRPFPDAGSTDATGLPGVGSSWSQRFGGPAGDSFLSLVVDPQVNSFLVSEHFSVDFGAGAVGTGGVRACVFLSSFNAAGSLRWSRPIMSWDQQAAATDDGHVLLLIPRNVLAESPIDTDLLANVGPEGRVAWMRRLGAKAVQLRAASGGSVLVETAEDPVLDQELGRYTSRHTIQLFSATGEQRAEMQFQAAQFSQTVLDPTAIHVVNGLLHAAPATAGQAIPPTTISKLDWQGRELWFKTLETSTFSFAVPAFDGGLWIRGFAAGAVDLGAGPLDPAMSSVAFVAHVDPAGTVIASRAFAAGLPPLTIPAPSGGLLLAGRFEGSLNLDGTVVHTANASDVDSLVLALDPSLKIERYWRYGNGGGTQEIEGLAVDANGAMVVGGVFEGKVDFGSGILRSAGEVDVFVARVLP